MTVGQLSAQMSSQEYTEWLAYFQLENEEMKKAELGRRAEQNSKNAGNQLRSKRR